jgi:hypothetical protein
MKPLLLSFSLLLSTFCFAQSPREVVQDQLSAYNAKDIDGFLKVFSEDAVAYNYGEAKPFIEGKANFRKTYGNLFNSSPQLHSEVLSRQIIGNTVVDYEYITGREGNNQPLLLIAIYTVKDGQITRCDFIRD